ncbi:uncharacterized SAM-binding protein YcdF (DUF218 family) [Deinobacterium chartae]|uniref:Uncharacterized SAM-binding protein YcdF (DUF218 family) n=1 Tax=Deinobacterium chartae TaxID=521158 RepID=A0A841I6Z2_9DEIO|nr:YdcF family protein [Deinobacterium chartae]MBB6099595.1 uncharacterized SAM-binding protein YcdF (DUF218 family) [Deinobacterium chartae]
MSQHRRRQGSALSATALSLVLLGGAVPLTLGLASEPHRAPSRPHPTLLVLGAAQYNGRPSPLFKNRLDHALKLYRAGGVNRVVVAGGVGTGDRFSEGAVGREYLIRKGIPAARVKAETRSRSTLQNLKNARALLEGPVTLVTDEVHAPRALALAQAIGLEANVSPCRLEASAGYKERYRLRERALLGLYTLLGTEIDQR